MTDHDVTALDARALVSVVGGADGPATTTRCTPIRVPVMGIPITVGKQCETRTDYAKCLETADQLKLGVDDTVKLCGQPKT